MSAPVLCADAAEAVERELEENGVRGKVIPPDGYLREKTAGKYADTIDAEVERVLDELLSAERIKRIVRRAFRERHNLPDSRRWIEEAFKEDGSLSWRTALEGKLARRSGELRAEVREAVEKTVRKMLAD